MNKSMRISFVLAREDNPRMYDELHQFPKGQRRVNRLRTLAYDGLLAQQSAPLRLLTPAEGVHKTDVEGKEATELAQASLELFSAPVAE